MFVLGSLTSAYRAKLIVDCYRPWTRPDTRLLDVGTGTGIVSHIIRKDLSVDLMTCDIVNNLQINIPFKKMNLPTKLPFPNQSFDIVLFTDCLHHCDYKMQEALLHEAKRVGKKIIVFEDLPNFIERVADFFINAIHYSRFSPDIHSRPKKEWEEFFQTLGMNVDSKKVRRPWFYPFSHIAFLLIPN